MVGGQARRIQRCPRTAEPLVGLYEEPVYLALRRWNLPALAKLMSRVNCRRFRSIRRRGEVQGEEVDQLAPADFDRILGAQLGPGAVCIHPRRTEGWATRLRRRTARGGRFCSCVAGLASTADLGTPAMSPSFTWAGKRHPTASSSSSPVPFLAAS